MRERRSYREGGVRATYNLKLDRLAFELNGTNLEVDANCGNIAFCVGIVCKTEEEAGLEESISANRQGVQEIGPWHLSDARITDEKELEEVVVLAGVHLKERGGEKKSKGRW